MRESNYKHGNTVGPFYRKFLAGDNVWCEINRASDGTGLWFHIGNSTEGPSPPSTPIYFKSEEHFLDFCSKLTGITNIGELLERLKCNLAQGGVSFT